MVQQKIVVQVQMNCDKCQSKVLKIAAVAYGVTSVAIQGKERDQVVIIGDGVDSAVLTSLLRKKVGYARLISVEEVKEKEKIVENVKVEIPTPCPSSCSQYPQFHMYEVVYEPSPSICSIM
ncbi:hypothetical protein HHK36_005876 [Tetracentron sinense]|uniref:HMA domain-containing protein n=1 Tax=Tetracentron sinense TaxID=13715 RepID=A0A834ZP54_TETSI|nr:hypothetical protein HHK36_005876 [Tetracentron sinense]